MFSLFILFLVVVDGEKISNREYLAMKRQLRILNKPGIKVIKTKYGDIYDCVDIHRQPALDHPLLKNHTVQMAPTYLPETPKRNVSRSDTVSIDISLPDGGCPEGSVPLLRMTVEDLIRAKSMKRIRRKQYQQNSGNFSVKVDGYTHHYAIVKAEGSRYYGLTASMNVWSPNVMYYIHSSIAQMWFYGGPLEHLNLAEAGWMSNPPKYLDARTRLFVFWTSESYRNGCYDRECPGFVHRSATISIPSFIEPLSTYNGEQYDITLQIYRDRNTGHWWLTYGENQEQVGYWPSNLLPHMRDYATAIHWGGEVAGMFASFPPMGSGHFAQEGYKKSCFMRNLKMVDEAGHLIDVPPNTQAVSTDITCYNIIDYLSSGDQMGRHIYFGGPGGRCRA
ncbi:protein neprosin-like [Aristolochia californica]|uniref:protein neprosin-like n=1 Tax=Aristolochia californica TaxID=171875 RepID=UPI0035D5DC83